MQPESLARIGRLLQVASSLTTPLKSADLIARAGAQSDIKGVLGALRMLEIEGVVHVQRGTRRQLIWHPGSRDPDESPPLVADTARYSMLGELLRNSSDTWISTDYLIRNADFDPHLLDVRLAEPLSPDRLPLNFFHDVGKSARKYVLGALKCLYWREAVAWRCTHHRQ